MTITSAGRTASLLVLMVMVSGLLPTHMAFADHQKDEIVDKTRTGTLELVSLTSDEQQGTSSSGTSCSSISQTIGDSSFGGWDGASMSDDGRFVAFSSASALVEEDTNPLTDIYLRDRRTGKTTLVSKTSLGLTVTVPDLPDSVDCIVGSLDPMVSGNGKYIAFVSRMPLMEDEEPLSYATLSTTFYKVYVVNRRTGQLERISKGIGGSLTDPESDLPDEDSGHDGVSISQDGRMVTFISEASNLVVDPPCPTAPCDWQAYSFDRRSGETRLLSHSPKGEPGNFDSRNVNVSDNGAVAVFQSVANNLAPGDSNVCAGLIGGSTSCSDVFVVDIAKDVVSPVSKTRDGSWGAQQSSLDWDGGHGQTVSSDGRFVLFRSGNADMVPSGGGGTFVRDLETGDIQRVSVTSSGELGMASWSSLSDDGRYVLGNGWSCSLVSSVRCLHTITGTFLHDRITGQTDNLKPFGNPADLPASLSSSGRYYVFTSTHDDYVDGDSNGVEDVFFRDLGPRGLGVLPTTNDAPWTNQPHGGRALFIEDPRGDVDLPTAGGDIVGGTVAHRPDLDDLYARIDLDRLEPVFGLSISPVMLSMRIRVDDRDFVVRFDPDPTDLLDRVPQLSSCDEISCLDIAKLDGSYGTVGESAVAAIPMDLLGIESVDEISAISLFSTTRGYGPLPTLEVDTAHASL